jgi:parallel beta-helix repeat protein
VLSVVVASDNLIESTQGDSDGIDLDGDASGQQGSVLADNTILDVGDDGIDLLDSSAMVSGNFVIDASDRGISVEGPGTPRIEGNVVSGCSTGWR